MGEKLLRSLFDHIDGGRWEEVGHCFRPDGTYQRSGSPTLAGSEAIVEFYRHGRGIASSRHTLEGVLVGPNQAAVGGHMTGVRDSGEPIVMTFADVFELDQEGIRQRRSHFYVNPTG